LISLSSASGTLQSFTYSKAPAGNILTETDSPSSSGSPATYTYDPLGRVATLTPGSGTALGYGFDASGNLTTLPNGANGTYDDAGELTAATLSGTTTNYSYNSDGQRVTSTQGSATLASAAWNGAAQLTSYQDSAANMTAASYDGNGLRASDAASSVSQSFTWNSTTSVPQLLMDSSNAYIYADSGTPIEQVSLATGTVTYLMTDSLGSVRGIVNTAGSAVSTAAYDAWGNPETSVAG
jgi:YD repeat-containing protein